MRNEYNNNREECDNSGNRNNKSRCKTIEQSLYEIYSKIEQQKLISIKTNWNEEENHFIYNMYVCACSLSDPLCVFFSFLVLKLFIS